MDYLRAEHQLSIRQGLAALKLSSSVYYYQPKVKNDQALIEALEAGVEAHPGWGFWKLYKHLRREGHPWNHKRVYRVYVMLMLPADKK